MAPRTKKHDLAWVAKNRGAVLETLAQLATKHLTPSDLSSDAGRAYQYLVGAGYALWRAVPLVEGHQPDRLMEQAGMLVTKIVQHNALTYMDEVTCAAWFNGFYLNVAETRIIKASQLLKGEALPSLNTVASNQNGKDRLFENRPERWVEAHQAFADLVARLSARAEA